jgi:uridine kinase
MYIIGIAGGSGSGKTTFAQKVSKLALIPVEIIHLDSYYLPLSDFPDDCYNLDDKPNFDHPQAFDWDLLNSHLHELRSGNSIETPVYDFHINSRTDATQTVSPSSVLIFEGIFALFQPDIRNHLDVKVFLHVDSDIRFTRRLDRDLRERGRSVDSIIQQYYDTVRPMHSKYLEPQVQYADFTVGEETDTAAVILAARVNEILHNTSRPVVYGQRT